MPNHCYGNLVVTGEPKLLNKFMKHVEITESEATDEHQARKFSLHKVIPQPKLQGDGWYDWRVTHWGTKWDLCDLQVIYDDWENGELNYEFWTAWSPPEPCLKKLTELFPELTFVYKFADEGGGFWGLWNFHNGEMETVEEGDGMNDPITCSVREDYFQQGSEHHLCHECQSEWLECEGESKQDSEYLCEDCKTSLEETEKDLWEENKCLTTT